MKIDPRIRYKYYGFLHARTQRSITKALYVSHADAYHNGPEIPMPFEDEGAGRIDEPFRRDGNLTRKPRVSSRDRNTDNGQEFRRKDEFKLWMNPSNE